MDDREITDVKQSNSSSNETEVDGLNVMIAGRTDSIQIL